MRKIKVGVIGLGMGRYHLERYAQCKGVEILALCDVSKSLLSEVSDKYDVPLTFTDYRKMLQVEELEAVSIATPNKFHAPMSIYALKHGKHVLCEKPMALNAKEAEKMLREAEKNKRKLMLHFNFRFSPQARFIKRYVESGKLGDLYYVKTGWLRQMGVPMRRSFTDKKISGGGPVIDLGVHRLDFALWLMGYPRAVSVVGETRDKIAGPLARKNKVHFDVEDIGVALIRLENEALIFMEASWAIKTEWPEEMYTQLFGTKAGLEQRNVTGTYNFGVKLFEEKKGKIVVKKPAINYKDGNPQAHFVDCIRRDTEPMATGRQGLEVMKILDAIYKSSRIKKEVGIAHEELP